MQAIKLDSLNTLVNSTLKFPVRHMATLPAATTPNQQFSCIGKKTQHTFTLSFCCFPLVVSPWVPQLTRWWQLTGWCSGHCHLCIPGKRRESVLLHWHVISPLCVGSCGKDVSKHYTWGWQDMLGMLGYPLNCSRESFLGLILSPILKDLGSVMNGSYLLCCWNSATSDVKGSNLSCTKRTVWPLGQEAKICLEREHLESGGGKKLIVLLWIFLSWGKCKGFYHELFIPQEAGSQHNRHQIKNCRIPCRTCGGIG